MFLLRQGVQQKPKICLISFEIDRNEIIELGNPVFGQPRVNVINVLLLGINPWVILKM